MAVKGRVVKFKFVKRPESDRTQVPIGVLPSLLVGFDRVAARPLLLLPPILLDLILWLGPRLWIARLAAQASGAIVLPPGADPTFVEQTQALREALTDFGARFNVLAALSSLPVGIPSLMSGRMPLGTPLGEPPGMQLPTLLALLAAAVAFTFLGLAMGSQYHIWAARQVAPQAEVARLAPAWGRVAALSLGVYLGVLGLLAATGLAATLAAWLAPWLGLLMIFMALSLVFWVAVYLMFTPHGIIRYRLGVLRSIVESVQVVRWNLVGTATFLAIAFGVTWLTGWVWSLPAENSWYLLLAVVGHAFVSATLLIGSYAFYQSRREWTLQVPQHLAALQAGGKTAPRPGSEGRGG